MAPDEIVPGGTYRGGKNGDLRTVTRFGAAETWVTWAPTHKRLPLGAFLSSESRTTTRVAFAKWAQEKIGQE